MLRGVAKCHERLCDNRVKPVIPIRQPTGRNLALSVFKALGDSSSPLALRKIASFPRKWESIGPTMGPRFRGGDAASDFHMLGWAKGLWKLLGMTCKSGCHTNSLGGEGRATAVSSAVA